MGSSWMGDLTRWRRRVGRRVACDCVGRDADEVVVCCVSLGTLMISGLLLSSRWIEMDRTVVLHSGHDGEWLSQVPRQDW